MKCHCSVLKPAAIENIDPAKIKIKIGTIIESKTKESHKILIDERWSMHNGRKQFPQINNSSIWFNLKSKLPKFICK